MPNYYIFLFKCVKKFLSYMLINNVRSKWEILICEILFTQSSKPVSIIHKKSWDCSEKIRDCSFK